MPSKTYNRTEDLVQKIGYPDDTEDEADLQTVLEEAHGQMQGRVGRNFVEDKRVRKQSGGSTFTSDIINEFNLKFSPLLEFDEILLDEHEVLDSSEYTVDKQNGTITIDQSYVDENFYLGQIIRVKYVPIQFKQAELWRAVEIVKNQELVQLEDSEQNALQRNALREAKRIENMINRRAGSGNATDGDIRRGTK